MQIKQGPKKVNSESRFDGDVRLEAGKRPILVPRGCASSAPFGQHH